MSCVLRIVLQFGMCILSVLRLGLVDSWEMWGLTGRIYGNGNRYEPCILLVLLTLHLDR